LDKKDDPETPQTLDDLQNLLGIQAPIIQMNLEEKEEKFKIIS
jgi:hypothetical protein